jgi:uncharacterized protein YkwD
LELKPEILAAEQPESEMNRSKSTFGLGCRGLAVLGLVCGGTAAFCREPGMIGTASASADASLSQVESAVIARTNAARARSGLPPLAADGQLMNGARNHARWMARNRNLSHGSGVTENIGMGQISASEAVSSWMNSSGHRANILGGGHTRIGVAMAHSADGTAYWCQQFR